MAHGADPFQVLEPALRKAHRADRAGAEALCRALAHRKGFRRPVGRTLEQFTEYVGILERRTKILARTRFQPGRDDIVDPYTLANIFIQRNRWVRPIGDYRRPSHNAYLQLQALIDHLFACYPTPRFLARAFEGDGRYIGLYLHVARGGNVRTCPSFEPRLTRAQAHLFHSSTDDGPILETALAAMAQSHQVPPAVARELIGHPAVQAGPYPFWSSFMEFLGRQHMVSAAEINPLCDYLRHHRVIPANDNQPEREMTFRGRTLKSLLERTHAWHQDLARARRSRNRMWKPIGEFEPIPLSKSGYGWVMTEILTERDLIAEGQKMHHCVYSYAKECHARQTSIFSLIRTSKELPSGERVLTVEVRPSDGRGPMKIVQARGRRNEWPKPEAVRAVLTWAQSNEVLPGVLG